MKNVGIRTMEEGDFKEAALIMAEAFGSKMPAMRPFSSSEVSEFLLAGSVFNPDQLHVYYVAIVEDKVAGIMHLETLKDKKEKTTPTKDAMYMMRRFGFFRVMLSAFSLMFLDNHLLSDEMIVDFIAVDPSYRGHGIGSKLLDFAEEVAVSVEGISRLTLGVIDENKGARRLYERKGFKVYKTKNSLIKYWLTGVRTSHMLEKYL